METLGRLRAPAAMLRAIRLRHGLDPAQARAVYRTARTRVTPGTRPIRPSAWHSWLAKQETQLLLDPLLDASDAVLILDDLTSSAVPDPHTMAALRELGDRAAKARAAERRQLSAAAGFRGVPLDTVRVRYAQLRHQWQHDLASRPAHHWPAPPDAWVRGFTGRDRMSCSTPNDPATLYAMYRLQTDPEILPPPSLPFAAVDLETAGPAEAAFDAERGCIIEVGIVHYDADGAVVDSYGQLVRPVDEADPASGGYGTGAVEVHGIAWGDVVTAPSWSQVAPTVAARLRDRVTIAHNLRFEREWLSAHLSAAGCAYDPWATSVDTLNVARQHRPDLVSHKLAEVCAHLGVTYDHGHRAVHDAAACGAALFALRRALAADWRRSPQRRYLEAPAALDLSATRPGKARRITADGVDHREDDPWAITQEAATAPAGGCDASR